MVKNITIYLVVILSVVSLLLSSCSAAEDDETIPSYIGEPVYFEIGYSILLEADLSNVSEADKAPDMAQLVHVLSIRLLFYNGNNSTVCQQGENNILVELPRDVDIEIVKSLLTTEGFLEFREVERDSKGDMVYLKDYLDSTANDFINSKENEPRYFVNQDTSDKDYGKLIAVLAKDENGLKFTDADGSPMGSESLKDYGYLCSWVPSRGNNGTHLTGSLLSDAQPNINPITEKPEVDIVWNDEGAIIFEEIAARLHNPDMEGTYSLKYALGIFLDRELLSAPQLISTKYEGKGTITGNFTLAEVEELANILKSSALSIPVTIVEVTER